MGLNEGWRPYSARAFRGLKNHRLEIADLVKRRMCGARAINAQMTLTLVNSIFDMALPNPNMNAPYRRSKARSQKVCHLDFGFQYQR